MSMTNYPLCTAFQGTRRVASGTLDAVAVLAKVVLERPPRDPVLVFDDATGQVVEVDFRGSTQDVLARLVARYAPMPARGRPRLGVQSREVSLLPRHWEWLAQQSGGASGALRRLVDEARRATEGSGQARAAQDTCYRAISVLAGNLPGYEEALRALYAADPGGFAQNMESWPQDVREYAQRLAEPAFAGTSQQ